jgi:hypothetical protein
LRSLLRFCLEFTDPESKNKGPNLAIMAAGSVSAILVMAHLTELHPTSPALNAIVAIATYALGLVVALGFVLLIIRVLRTKPRE